MKMYYSIGVFSVCFNFIFVQALPLKQSFEGELSDNWNFTTNPVAFNDGSGDIWDRVSSSDYISGASDGSWFWECRDFNGKSTEDAGYLTFTAIDLASIGACTLTFDYYASSGFEELHGDGVGYEIIYDDATAWDDVPRVEFEQDTSEEWVTATISISADKDYLRIRLWAYTSADTEFAGFDNIQLTAGETIQPDLTIESPADGSYYENCISNIAVSGSATNISGMIVWSNELNDLSGEIAATSIWSIASVTLAEGNNKISVTATNENELNVTDSIDILRGKSFSTAHLGSIAFVGFNTSTDSFSFAALKSLPAGTVIRFTDEEWGGTAFTSENIEDDLVWSNTVQTVAGTIVEFYDCDGATTVSNNIGVLVSGKLILGQDGENIFAYYGPAEREPSAFLAAISTESGNLNGTGLNYGETAVDISKTTLSQYYCGIRSGKQEWNSYLPLINTAANWTGTEGVTESWGSCAAFICKKAGAVMLVK